MPLFLRGLAPCLLGALLAAPATGEERSTWPRVGPQIAGVVLPALELASQRIDRGACPALFEEFRDARTGRPLAEALAETGKTPSGFLRSVAFLDGSRQRRCADRRILAVTVPGSPVVFVCRSQFENAMKKDWGSAATVVIHEALHALGLGEDPPTSEEITLQVEKRCGR